MLILKGNIISSPKFGELSIVEHGYLISDVEGKIIGVFSTLPKEYDGKEVKDYGDKLIMQSFSDMHLHAPQYPMLGMGMDLQLIDWLNTYTFPTEANFKDNDLARKIYHRLALELIKNGTTRVAMFSSLHKEATLILMDELEKAGVCGYVGKVNMDRNGGVDLEETTEESIKSTNEWLKECKFTHVKPIITPRFTPSCTNELMEELGKIAKEHDLPIQSHLSENTGEIAWVKELHPDCKEYWETYKKYNLWNDKTLMAHCVHSSLKERTAMKDAGVYVVHCAASNNNLISGVAPIKLMKKEGLRVVLGSDIAGGDQLSMFDVVASTIKASKNRDIMDKWESGFLSVEEAYYLGTSAANSFFNEKEGFAKGNKLHCLVLDDSDLVSVRPLSVKERFERSMYLREKDAIKAVISDGRIVYNI
ncbi:MAG: amidohydrolase family protein [Bacilli bacterium]|nr:amidohydrolase family protein [Bacilli bacterium]